MIEVTKLRYSWVYRNRTCKQIEIAWDDTLVIVCGVLQWKESAMAAVVKEEDVSWLGLPMNHCDQSLANVFAGRLCIRLVCFDKEINIFFGNAEAMNEDSLHLHNVVDISVNFIF